MRICYCSTAAAASCPDGLHFVQQLVSLNTTRMGVAVSMLEGGGQILRNATALAAITGTPVQVDRIRAGEHLPVLS